MTLCDERSIGIDNAEVVSVSVSVSVSASASAPEAATPAPASRNAKLLARRRPKCKRKPTGAALLLASLGLHLSLAVLLASRGVEALLPVGGNRVCTAAGSPGMADSVPTPARAGKIGSAHTEGDRGSNAPAQLSAPVLELITPDGCASSSASDMSSLIQNVQRAVAGGVSLVQLRDYESDADSKAEMAVRLFAATNRSALLVVNGDPEAARASGADGVHLPERMMDLMDRLAGLRAAGEWPRVVGCSVHSVAAAVKAARLGADYVQVCCSER